ncbi:MAG: response regulator, partial [Marinoscillum sp.]
MKERDKKKLKVLILEDVESDAELVKLQFEQLDFQCSFVVTYKENEYMDLLKSFNPDMVTSDFTMPTFDGLKALKILRTKDPITPFIFVTGSLGEENAVKAIKTGATDFINKNRIEQLTPAALR